MKMILVLNFGAQYGHLIARRIRDLGVYSEVAGSDISIKEIKKLNPNGIILSGGPFSVSEENGPTMDPGVLELKIPILGICYGLQLIAKLKGGKVLTGGLKEYGKAVIKTKNSGKLLKGLSKKEQVWMSHGDSVEQLPPDFEILASTDNCKVAAVENDKKKIYGVQFHPEVIHTKSGNKIIENFAFGICKSEKDWNIKNLTEKVVTQVKKEVGNNLVIMGVSGGVDSTVAAHIIHQAIGDRIHCVFIDHGLIRKNESKEVKDFFENKLKFKHFYMVDASEIFLKKLKGVTDPEKKRKIIGHAFIEVFEKKVSELEKIHPAIKFLGQGTIYPDRIESAEPSKHASKIKSHHNLSLPEKMKLKVLEPLKDFYKDEVRELGKEMNIPDKLLNRHPFPGPGLAIRILGQITGNRLKILRDADHIFIEELKNSNYYDKTWQALAALLPVKTVGVKGDGRTYEYIISLRAVTSVDAMTADWARLPDWLLEKISNRIINEVAGVNRVLYDISQKPPATIEYE
jgi:GMP synthase (glutamine-hydrolysing)